MTLADPPPEKRRHLRYCVSWQARVQSLEMGVFTAQVVDVSTHGLALLADVPLYPGTLVTVEVTIPAGNTAWLLSD